MESKGSHTSRPRGGGSMALVTLLIAVVAVLFTACASGSSSPNSGTQATQSQTTASETEQPTSATEADTEASTEANSETDAQARAEISVIEFSLEGTTESVEATLYTGDGYSLYIPSEGWTVSEDEGRVAWTSTANEAVSLTITAYTGTTSAEARSAYAADSSFTFEDLNGGEFGNPLFGQDENGNTLALMSAEKDGTVYILAWSYPNEAAEGFGARLQQIAGTFEAA